LFGKAGLQQCRDKRNLCVFEVSVPLLLLNERSSEEAELLRK
jgi:hypothetical protein